MANGLPTIKKNSQGLTVAYCQNLLNARLPDRPPLWVDGIFGPKTDTRVRKFQNVRKLTPDGIVGPITWAALEAGPPPINKRPSRAATATATAPARAPAGAPPPAGDGARYNPDTNTWELPCTTIYGKKTDAQWNPDTGVYELDPIIIYGKK